jgi:septal ring-binding cell division protein DamX
VGFIEQLQTELKDALVEHQAHVLVRVLQKRLDTLTFGELRSVMDSRIGQGLASILVRDLVAAQASPAAPVPIKPGRRTRNAKTARRHGKGKTVAAETTRTKRGSAKAPAKTASKATTAKAATKTAQARPPKVSALTVAGRESYDNALVQFLRTHPGFNRPSDIRMAAGGTKLQLRSAMQRLMKAGVVERQGSHSSTRYAAKPT